MESVNATAPTVRKKTGRPLSFVREDALKKAMLVFWEHGYETTSIVDLTTAMQITAPSLYAAFGDKRRLFLEAARLYAGDPDTMARALDDAPTAYDAVEGMLTAAAMAFTGEATPKGCLLASATASGSIGSVDVQKEIADIRRGIDARLRNRIERDRVAGIISKDTDAAALSNLIMVVTQGLSGLARDGASRKTLLAVVETALKAWPNQIR